MYLEQRVGRSGLSMDPGLTLCSEAGARAVLGMAGLRSPGSWPSEGQHCRAAASGPP